MQLYKKQNTLSIKNDNLYIITVNIENKLYELA